MGGEFDAGSEAANALAGMADAALSHIPPALQSEGVSVTGSGGTAPVIPGTPVQPVVFEAVAVAVQPDKDWPDASKVDADKRKHLLCLYQKTPLSVPIYHSVSYMIR